MVVSNKMQKSVMVVVSRLFHHKLYNRYIKSTSKLMAHDEQNQCNIHFSKLEDAKATVTLNGQLEIAGRVIKVSSVTDHVGVQDLGTKTVDFDDDNGGGLKLDRSGTATSAKWDSFKSTSWSIGCYLTLTMNGQVAIPAALLPTIVVSEPIGIPSECHLLKNMFDPTMEMDPEYDLEIKDDVKAECSKYGPVLHIHVDNAGYVYLRFETIQASVAAQAAMHKRWFARKMISAVFLEILDGIEFARGDSKSTWGSMRAVMGHP
ncbi:RNA-binding protein 39-like [Impatiens glandulifera]|uniref:RNA-binding protein 39-like n=1 Tax=Impatiens glandulifera TaxID=253017 RepID=UPI001FB0D95A|nr:RNA-binding protein 39-like [Impatiens glandulifera]